MAEPIGFFGKRAGMSQVVGVIVRLKTRLLNVRSKGECPAMLARIAHDGSEGVTPRVTLPKPGARLRRALGARRVGCEHGS